MDNTTLDTTLNNQTDLNSLLQNSSGSLIPESFMQSLMTMILVSTIISCVVLGLFLVLYTIAAIRKWKVQSAVLHMQKDLSEIKQLLIDNTQSGNTLQKQETTPATDVAPSSSSDSLIADNR